MPSCKRHSTCEADSAVAVHLLGAADRTLQGDTLGKDETRALFRRDGSIKAIDVTGVTAL